MDVGILDSGIDGNHADFKKGVDSNVDCARGRDSVGTLPPGAGVGTPDPCVDNQFHGTHVAGIVAARANGIGVVGVAPNVTLVPVKVCDATGYCYASAVVDGITYAGDEKLDVINMSFFVDDNAFQESTEFKCNTDPKQRAFRRAVERAIQYARKPGRRPGRCARQLRSGSAHPSTTPGSPSPTSATSSRRRAQASSAHPRSVRRSGKAGYSNYGTGATDVAAPGGNGTTGDCTTTVHVDAPTWAVRLHPGHLDGLAAHRRRGSADREPVREARARTAT